jgi:hypothetical protein
MDGGWQRRDAGSHATSHSKATLVSRKGDSVGTVSFSDDGADGEISVRGQDVSHSAELAKGDAGLYRATRGAWDTPGSVEAGWILLADGTQRGALAKSGPEEADAGAGPTLRFAIHLGVILENVAALDPATGSANLGSLRKVSVQNVTSVGSLSVGRVS